MLVSPDGKFKFENLSEGDEEYALWSELRKVDIDDPEYTAHSNAVRESCGMFGCKLFDPNPKSPKNEAKDFSITKVENGKAYIADWVDGCHSCAVNLTTGNIIAYITVDGYGEWCGVRPLTDEEKSVFYEKVQKFLADKEDRKA